jgi:microcystin-dependent protein
MSLIRNGRILVYPAENLLDTDLLRMEIFRMNDISKLAQTIIGGWPISPSTPSAIAAGLNATPTVSPAFSVTVAPGVIYQYEQFDSTAYGSVPSDTTQYLYKQGINLLPTQLDDFNPASTPGDSIAYLIQAALLTADVEVTTRQYFNPSDQNNPITMSAPDVRTDTVSLTIKASAQGVTPVIPTPDAGHIGLWVVTVPQGATVITSGMIAEYSGSSFVSETLPQKVSYTSLQQSTPIYGLDTSGAANTITVTATPTYTSNGDGAHIWVKVANTNTGATGMDVSGTGSLPVRKSSSLGLVALTGAELQAGGIYEFMSDGTYWQLLTPSVASILPAGMIADFGMASAPPGWLLCDGSVVSQSTYAALYAAIGSTWNTGGEGAGNFRLPNAQRRNRVGSGGSATSTAFTGTTVGSYGGEETHTLLEAELAPHTHTTGAGSILTAGTGIPYTDTAPTSEFSSTSTTTSTGSGTAFNEMPLGMIVTMCIKT